MKTCLVIPLVFVLVTVVAAQGSHQCDDCLWNEGVYNAPHETTCCKYYDCERIDAIAGIWDSHVRQCSDGLYWNRARLACDYPKDAKCPQDPCDTCIDGLKVADGCTCYGYFICGDGVGAIYETCDNGWRFNGVTCVEDANCIQTDPDIQDPWCPNHYPHPTLPNKFLVDDDFGTRHTMTCGPGTVWSQSKCACDHDQGSPQCNPIVDIDFSTPLSSEYVFKNVGIETVDGLTVGSFDGSSQITIPRMTNIGDLSELYIEIKFKETFTDQNEEYLLFSNCACDGTASIRTYIERHGTDIEVCAQADTGNMQTVCTDILTSAGHWKTHVYKFDNGAFMNYGVVGSDVFSNFITTSGSSIENRHFAFHIGMDDCDHPGNCNGFSSFEGYIDWENAYRTSHVK